MKVVLYMAMSLNGIIARENDDTSFIPEVEWNSYSAAVRKAGSLIVGHRTYDILTKQPEFQELKKVNLVVVSNKKFKTLAPSHLVANSPREALNLLKDFSTVVVAGGGILNSAFMKENLIDDIYVDVEPLVIGKGIKLFTESDFETKLSLIGTKKISKNEIQLHYKVVK